jgi:hypothetical protein
LIDGHDLFRQLKLNDQQTNVLLYKRYKFVQICIVKGEICSSIIIIWFINVNTTAEVPNKYCSDCNKEPRIVRLDIG